MLPVSHAYQVELGTIRPGVPFMMVNYQGVYIRVDNVDLKVCYPGYFEPDKQYSFNDDGSHVPIVELATGHLFYMAKVKPCLVYPGEDVRRIR